MCENLSVFVDLLSEFKVFLRRASPSEGHIIRKRTASPSEGLIIQRAALEIDQTQWESIAAPRTLQKPLKVDPRLLPVEDFGGTDTNYSASQSAVLPATDC